jgi:hypothetical protein
MEIALKRYSITAGSTGGLLSINGGFFCYALEDQPQEIKVAGETSIPPGRYEIKFRDAGGMNDRYKGRFDDHVGMLHLQNVPSFRWIYIHPGNTDSHTEGCILVGFGTDIRTDHSLIRSVEAYRQLYWLIKIAIFDKGEQVFITVGEL